ncbi:MAG: hypothetical protein WAN43_10425 [Rhodomicrobium sp.]|jgi:H+-transporting ATPase
MDLAPLAHPEERKRDAISLPILVVDFYPVTLNDGAILSIAYDNVHYKAKPEAWNMRLVLGIATVLGVTGVVSAFGLFYLGERVFDLDRAHIQTLMYLKLSVAGHLTKLAPKTKASRRPKARSAIRSGPTPRIAE